MNFYQNLGCTEEPIVKLDKWLQQATKANVSLPHAMSLATVDEKGCPSARMVLLKYLSDEGLIFFTDYLSKKGKDISTNQRAAVNFWWAEIDKQVRLEGICSKVSTNISEEYFNSRPRDSQISASVSYQSSVIENYEDLVNETTNFANENRNKKIPRPERWGGFLLKPSNIEFWTNKDNRLHERKLYIFSSGKWVKSLLSP